jgi:predicted transcriptional regulator
MTQLYDSTQLAVGTSEKRIGALDAEVAAAVRAVDELRRRLDGLAENIRSVAAEMIGARVAELDSTMDAKVAEAVRAVDELRRQLDGLAENTRSVAAEMINARVGELDTTIDAKVAEAVASRTLSSDAPAGAILMFARPSCPEAWEEVADEYGLLSRQRSSPQVVLCRRWAGEGQ